MQCPTDGTVLTMSERSGIEIDYCPTCRGVWLDRGELDKVLERSYSQQVPAAPAQAASAPAPVPAPAPTYDSRRDDRGYDSGRNQSDDYQQGKRKPKRKESWLSELFE